MKLPFIIYAQAIGLYLVVTLPALLIPAMYIISAGYAIISGFAALVVFLFIFLILHFLKPPPSISVVILMASVAVAVCVAFKLLLLSQFPNRAFWWMDGDTLFPLAAILSGWVAVGINAQRIKAHFSPAPVDNAETIFS